MIVLEGIVGNQREYIQWLVSECTMDDTPLSDILEAEAIELLAARLRTPLQIEQHLTLALEAAYRVAVKPVTAKKSVTFSPSLPQGFYKPLKLSPFNANR
jgi:type II secretory pathway predicted ATPase ExeA